MPQEVVITGWSPDVGAVLELVFLTGLLFGGVIVALVCAAALAILTRRGS